MVNDGNIDGSPIATSMANTGMAYDTMMATGPLDQIADSSPG